MSLHTGCRNRFIFDHFPPNATIILALFFWLVWMVEFRRPNTGHTSALFFPLPICHIAWTLFTLVGFYCRHNRLTKSPPTCFGTLCVCVCVCVCAIIRESSRWLHECFRNGPLHQYWSFCSQGRMVNNQDMVNRTHGCVTLWWSQ